MQNKNEVQQGWEFAARILGADIVAHMGAAYVSAVEAAIKQLEDNINNHQYRNLGIKQLQGYMLEEWSSSTFNVDAVAADSADRASVLHSTTKDSADIQLKSGDAYSAKSYRTAEQTAKAQARINPDTGQASYQDQGRLVPSDQLDVAKETAHREGLRNKPIRENVSKAYNDTEKRLTDKITNDEGVESRPASRKGLEKIAKESKKQNFKAEEHGITTKSAIRTEYLLKQALKAGYTTAAITVAVQLVPEIYKAIDFLIKNGELDLSQIKHIGEKGISAGAEGFLRGSTSSALLIMCKSGILGEALKRVNPTLLGTVVALVMQTAKNSILVAAGKMSTQQMGAAFVDMVVVTGGYLAGAHLGGIVAHLGGIVGQALVFQFPVLGYLLGSLIGTSFCVVYNIGKKKLISFCVDTGFTCFGLVEQNYELPEDVLHEMGVETISIPRTRIETVELPRTAIRTSEIRKADYETIDITVLRRGVIGVNKIGYVFS
ncbi:MAG: hypothetical protein ACOYI7_09655 [Candidatus Excrementavichristensenella sp.]|jgi:hypothetical protein